MSECQSACNTCTEVCQCASSTDKIRKYRLRYRLYYMIDDCYEICSEETGESMYQGDIASCNAWIHLRESGGL